MLVFEGPEEWALQSPDTNNIHIYIIITKPTSMQPENNMFTQTHFNKRRS